jgi:hypothetical protein
MIKQVHFNKPQLRSQIIGAPNEYLVAGRGTGKTEGVLAPKDANCYLNTMPRSTGVIIAATYTQALTRTLPAYMAGLERIGYIYGHHYLIGETPSQAWIKKWKWQGPYRRPLNFKYFMCWWNGSGNHIISQDRKGSSNGLTIDHIKGDEAKLLNEEKLTTELFPANRGIVPAFANNPYHHGITFTTDMPVGTSGRWILDKLSAMDVEVVNEIFKNQVCKFKLRYVLTNGNAKQKAEAAKQVAIIDDEINDLRKGLLYYHEASTLDNIHALGIDYIKQQLRDTSEFQFDTQILNLRPMKLENGFYPDFDEERHGYFSENESYFDNSHIDFLNPTLDCRKDKDLNPNLPLHIALDYNRRIHPLVVAQDTGSEIKLLNGLHALYPAKLKDVLKQFNEYYKPLKKRLIYYWYDHTAVSDKEETRICDDVIAALRKGGWIVKPMYMGQAPSHEGKYRMYGHLLQEDKYYDRVLTFNRENCKSLITSVNLAGTKYGQNGFEKNKDPEKDPKYPAEEATHYSDALDMLVYGMLESKLKYSLTSIAATNSIIIGH